MAKQQSCQRFIFKIHSTRLRKSKWNLTLPISEARKNDEVISLSDSQILRFIDRLNNIVNADEKARDIKRQIKSLRKLPNSIQNRRKIKRLYAELDEIQFKPDYMCLIIDKNKDYWRACKGFKINDVEYVRLLGTNGGIKQSTIVFVSKRLAPELKRLIDNGRNTNKELVPAKFEAYRALICSGSNPVSMPNGIAVVDDCVTHFKSDVIFLNDENDGEPEIGFQTNAEVELDESDGYGIMLPSLAERWSMELGLHYTVSAVNTRLSFEKGVCFTFDFLDFADNVAGTRIIKDAWGNDVDLSNVELILTTSMLKLWDSYDSCEHYLQCCRENGYTFGITKTSPKKLEKERSLNYQFIQSYDLSDDDIEELISPTIHEIHDILGLDWKKTVLFLKGVGLTDSNVDNIKNDFAKAIMVDSRVLNDSFVQKKIYAMIKKRITDAKIGVIKVHGNYSIVCGDPYALCQHMFGMEVTGLLSTGEIYNKYWLDSGANQLACFRAPMTCHNNIRLMTVNRSAEALHWYQYLTTVTLLNAWDTTAHALNGCDKDGDLIFLTNNNVLVNRLNPLPVLMCVQRRANKSVVAEEDLIQANIASFGDDIGKVTNRATTMYDVISQFPADSEEHRVLEYRIMSSQLFQQNSIDKAKGIVCKPMPRTWFDTIAIKESKSLTDEEKVFYTRIVADKKPYFMRYIYPTLMKEYNTYITNTNKKSLREFRISMNELLSIPYEHLTEEQKQFIHYYYQRMPVGNHDCVMNRICRRFEQEFDNYLAKNSHNKDFDYTVMKSGYEYSKSQHDAVLRLYNAHNRRMREYMQHTRSERVDKDESTAARLLMVEEFKRECVSVCSDKSLLCDIILDICYEKEGSKQFAWDVVSEEIVENLLRNNDYTISYPVKSEDGDVVFGGESFTFHSKQLQEAFYEHSIE